MYISKTQYEIRCSYVDLDDRSFFMEALDEAVARVVQIADGGFSVEALKKNCPVAHISKLSKQSKHEDIVDRKYVHSARARRSFIMGDVDYNPGEEDLSSELRRRLIAFADKHKTPLMIYPTLSAPRKPRFRFVFLTARGMNYENYAKAMTWLYQELDMKITDDMDYSMKVNRNLPVFNNEEQVELIYNTFTDESLVPLNNTLWKDTESAIAVRANAADFTPTNPRDHAIKINPALAVEAAKQMSHSKTAKSYRTFWPIVGSIAASVASGGMVEDTAFLILDALAYDAPNDIVRKQWQAGNKELFYTQLGQLKSEEDFENTKAFTGWSEFSLTGIH